MLAAITPMSTRGLVRFDDTLMSWANREKGLNGLGNTPNPPGTADNPIYDPDSGQYYVLDDYGNYDMVPISAPLNPDLASSTNILIPGTTPAGANVRIPIPGTGSFQLPGGVDVTFSNSTPRTTASGIGKIPSSYLLLGAGVFLAVMLLRSR